MHGSLCHRSRFLDLPLRGEGGHSKEKHNQWGSKEGAEQQDSRADEGITGGREKKRHGC